MTTTVTFTLTERKRIHILRELDAKRLTAREAAVTCPPDSCATCLVSAEVNDRVNDFWQPNRCGLAESAISKFDRKVIVC